MTCTKQKKGWEKINQKHSKLKTDFFLSFLVIVLVLFGVSFTLNSSRSFYMSTAEKCQKALTTSTAESTPSGDGSDGLSTSMILPLPKRLKKIFSDRRGPQRRFGGGKNAGEALRNSYKRLGEFFGKVRRIRP